MPRYWLAFEQLLTLRLEALLSCTLGGHWLNYNEDTDSIIETVFNNENCTGKPELLPTDRDHGAPGASIARSGRGHGIRDADEKYCLSSAPRAEDMGNSRTRANVCV